MSKSPDVSGRGDAASLPDAATLGRLCDALALRPVGVSTVDPTDAAANARRARRRRELARWTAAGHHGEMTYLARDIDQRADPGRLVPGARSVVMVALSYAGQEADWIAGDWQRLNRSASAYVSNYARGRDYHRILRRRLQQLADRLVGMIGPFAYRATVDSAPVMEVALAAEAGLGWRGKHTLLLNRQYGSMFFLGALITDRRAGEPQAAAPAGEHCGSCRRCLDVCPTRAILAPGRLDATRCISYLTIELKGSIPIALRPLIGNRIYGCDDCQLVCPWNRFAGIGDPAFAPRHGLQQASLAELFAWSEQDFDERTRGSPIRRIGHERWLRNIAVALGNVGDAGAAPSVCAAALAALAGRAAHDSALVREHVRWAMDRLS